MCEKERRSLFRPVLVRTNIGTSAENLCQMLRKGSDLANTLLLQALLDFHQKKPVRVKNYEPVDLEPLKKFDEV